MAHGLIISSFTAGLLTLSPITAKRVTQSLCPVHHFSLYIRMSSSLSNTARFKGCILHNMWRNAVKQHFIRGSNVPRRSFPWGLYGVNTGIISTKSAKKINTQTYWSCQSTGPIPLRTLKFPIWEFSSGLEPHG